MSSVVSNVLIDRVARSARAETVTFSVPVFRDAGDAGFSKHERFKTRETRLAVFPGTRRLCFAPAFRERRRSGAG